MRKVQVFVMVLAAVVLGSILPADRAGAVSAARSVFIVELAAPPLATFSVAGAGAGDRPVLGTAAAGRYAARLAGHQSRVLRRAGATSAPVIYDYRVAFPGFAARLTEPEAARLGTDPTVRAITRDGVSRLMAAGEPAGDEDAELGRDGAAFLGLPGGLWEDLGGPDQAGEDVVIGVLDTGIYPEHPSFADQPGDDEGEPRYRGPEYGPPPPSWAGVCQKGEDFTAEACNDKLIGARYFVEGFGEENLHPEEFLSPRDADGHGSHTAATAAGNYGVDPVVAGHDLGVPTISGIAPRARLAAYKICWTRKAADEPGGGPVDMGSCSDSDAVAAVDAAVADGVDVINYSVGTPDAAVTGPVERAFLFAAHAGVFVAASAGNDGPEGATVGSPAGVPWVTAVAATTLGRTFESTLRVTPGDGGGEPLATTGATLSRGVEDRPLVDSVTVPAADVPAEEAELCFPGSLDPARVEGRVVLCKRGKNPRVEKGKVVADAGGAGMILYNAEADEETVADVHHLPAVHVTLADGQAVKELLAAGEGVRATIGGAEAVDAPGDRLGAFSSRGPQAAVVDIGKPDVAAPGVDILAAFTPTPAGDFPRKGETFGVLSGTSMSSPHVAGAAALLLQRHPTRSPAALKSALMTTADPDVVLEDGQTRALPFDVGSGRIDPTRAATPGLVLEAGLVDYARYLEGQDPEAVEGDLAPLPAADLNLPSITYSGFTGTATTTRTFTAVDGGPTAWTVATSGLAGIEVEATPASFEVSPGQRQEVRLRFTLAGAPAGSWVFGALVLTAGDGRTARLPLSLRPVRIAAPPTAVIGTTAASGSAPVRATAGYEGELSALGWGLAPPRHLPGETVGTAVAGVAPHQPGPGVDVFDVTVPAGAQVLAAEVGNADGGAADVDLDLYLFHDDEGDGFGPDEVLATSADADADETIVVAGPAPGAYRFAVVGYETREPVTVYDFTSWVGADPSPDDPATPSSAPGLAVRGDPKTVGPGEAVALDLVWSGLPAPGAYLGIVTFHDSATPDPARPVALTLVRIAKRPPP